MDIHTTYFSFASVICRFTFPAVATRGVFLRPPTLSNSVPRRFPFLLKLPSPLRFPSLFLCATLSRLQTNKLRNRRTRRLERINENLDRHVNISNSQSAIGKCQHKRINYQHIRNKSIHHKSINKTLVRLSI